MLKPVVSVPFASMESPLQDFSESPSKIAKTLKFSSSPSENSHSLKNRIVRPQLCASPSDEDRRLAKVFFPAPIRFQNITSSPPSPSADDLLDMHLVSSELARPKLNDSPSNLGAAGAPEMGGCDYVHSGYVGLEPSAHQGQFMSMLAEPDLPFQLGLSFAQQPDPYIEVLRLLNPKDPAVKLANWIFSSDRASQERAAIKKIALLFFQPSLDAFHHAANEMRGSLRTHFGDQLSALESGGQKQFGKKILLSYLKLFAPDIAPFISEKHLELEEIRQYPPFPFTPFDGTVMTILHHMIQDSPMGELERLVESILPDAWERQILSNEQLTKHMKKILSGILYPGARIICPIENSRLIALAISKLSQIVYKSQDGELAEVLNRFKSLTVLNMVHLKTLEYKHGKLVGLHRIPNGGMETFVQKDQTVVEAHVACPQLRSPSAIMAPVEAEVTAGNKRRRRLSKVSTFSLENEDDVELVRKIERALLNPINILRESCGSIVHYAREENKALRVVHLHPSSPPEIGTSYLMPFGEMRSRNSNKEYKPLHEITIQFEEGGSFMPIPPLASPQRKLARYVREHANLPPSNSMEIVSAPREEIESIIGSIQKLLQGKGALFTIIPTPPNGPILIKTTWEACDISIGRILALSPTSQRGRSASISKEELDKAFQGQEVVLQYESWVECVAALMQSNQEMG